MKIRVLDVAAIACSFLAVAAFSYLAYAGIRRGGEAVIEASGAKWLYPLDADRLERIPGPHGDTLVEIRSGAVRVVDSPCPDKLCVHAGAISRPGQWIACLPNRVLVRIGGDGDQAVDETSY